MKKVLFFLVCVLSLCVFSCDYEVKESDSTDIRIVGRRKAMESRSAGGVDMSAFFDVTFKDVDANDVMSEEVYELVKGKSYRAGNTVISFSRNKMNVNVNIAGCDLKEYEGANISYSYEYEVKAASKNLIYICPKDYRTVKVNINDDVKSGRELGQFALYFPLYGFGESRLEVSKHLNSEALVKGNTYWLK